MTQDAQLNMTSLNSQLDLSSGTIYICPVDFAALRQILDSIEESIQSGEAGSISQVNPDSRVAVGTERSEVERVDGQ